MRVARVVVAAADVASTFAAAAHCCFCSALTAVASALLLLLCFSCPDLVKQLFGLLRFVVKWFFISTVAYSVFDLAVGSKLVPTSSVHIAETSDKTFEDVVGIDEVRKITKKIFKKSQD